VGTSTEIPMFSQKFLPDSQISSTGFCSGALGANNSHIINHSDFSQF
jgi:hypothetical protein